MSRQKRIPTPSWQQDSPTHLTSNRMKFYGLIGVVVLVIAAFGVIGFGFLSDYLSDRNRPTSTAIQVDDYRYNVRDFTKRAKIYIEQIGGTASASIIIPTVSQQIIEEALLTRFASEKEVSATDEEIKGQIATLLGITADDANFDARFQEELASSGLSEEQYRTMATSSVLQTKLIDKFEEELPATVESVHYRSIQVADQTTADDLKAQIDGGADFAELAKEFSLDTSTKEAGGDAGWIPKGVANEQLETLLFSLTVDEVVTYPTQAGVTLYQVTESDDARPIDDDKKTTLATADFNEWLSTKLEAADITNDMDTATGDGDKLKYVIEHAGLTIQ